MSSYLPDNNVYPTEFENCPPFLENYLNYQMNNQGKRPLTLSQSILTLREFCQYVHFMYRFHQQPPSADAHKDMGLADMQLGELSQLQQADIEEYISFLELTARNSASTLYRKLSILRSFFDYMVKIESETGVHFVNANPAKRIVSPVASETAQFVLSKKQLQHMIWAVPEETRLRDQAVMMLLATTGLTLSELAFIRMQDFRSSGWLSVTNGSGTRGVWLTNACSKAVNNYLRYCGVEIDDIAPNQYIFQAARQPDRPISQRSIRNIVARAAKNAQIRLDCEITPKTLRDTVAHILYEYAEPHEAINVSQYLGYRTLTTRDIHNSTGGRYAEDAVMKAIVQRSPLNDLGLSPAEVKL